MNSLSMEQRTQIIATLFEGNSIRATSLLTGAAQGTALKQEVLVFVELQAGAVE